MPKVDVIKEFRDDLIKVRENIPNTEQVCEKYDLELTVLNRRTQSIRYSEMPRIHPQLWRITRLGEESREATEASESQIYWRQL